MKPVPDRGHDSVPVRLTMFLNFPYLNQTLLAGDFGIFPEKYYIACTYRGKNSSMNELVRRHQVRNKDDSQLPFSSPVKTLTPPLKHRSGGTKPPSQRGRGSHPGNRQRAAKASGHGSQKSGCRCPASSAESIYSMRPRFIAMERWSPGPGGCRWRKIVAPGHMPDRASHAKLGVAFICFEQC